MYNIKSERDLLTNQFEKRLVNHDFFVQDISLFEEMQNTFEAKRMSALFMDLEDNMTHFIEKSTVDKHAQCHSLLLGQTVVTYFYDLYCQAIQPNDDIKSLAYLAYWLLKIKPIQIDENPSFPKEKTQAYLCLNEKFIATYVLSHLVDNFRQEQLSQALKETIHFFQYQPCTPQSLEALLLSVLAHLNGTK